MAQANESKLAPPRQQLADIPPAAIAASAQPHIPASSASAEQRFLSERQLANRWGLSPKTLQRWRSLGRGPVFAKFSKKVSYPLEGQDGILEWEQRILYRSTSERANA